MYLSRQEVQAFVLSNEFNLPHCKQQISHKNHPKFSFEINRLNLSLILIAFNQCAWTLNHKKPPPTYAFKKVNKWQENPVTFRKKRQKIVTALLLKKLYFFFDDTLQGLLPYFIYKSAVLPYATEQYTQKSSVYCLIKWKLTSLMTMTREHALYLHKYNNRTH